MTTIALLEVPAMPPAGELGDRRRTSTPGLSMALVAVLVLCCALPAVAFASPRSLGGVWSVQLPNQHGQAPLATAVAHAARHRSHAVGRPRGCANAEATTASTPDRVLRRAVVCLVNQERARFGLPSLHPVPRLTTSAQSYTAWMVRIDFFSHTGPNGNSNPGMRIAATGFRWSWAGENIASGFPTPLSVVTAWMHSQGHCYNLLAPVFADVGIGVSPHPVAQARGPATWTQDFGLPLGWNAPSGNWGPANSCPH